MLDFRTKTKSKNRPYGPEVSRWVWLVFFLGLVLVVGTRLLEQDTWHFLGRGLWRAVGEQEPAIDNRLVGKPKEEASGALVFVPVENVFVSEEKGPGHGRPLAVLSSEQLEAIQDDSPFRKAELEAWRRLLQWLHEAPEEELQKQSEGQVSYGHLFRQSASYRGRLVTVRGQMRRAHRVGMISNPWGQEYYYQTWLQPADQPSCPMQIYCLELPEGFPLGMSIEEPVEVTGFYFKRMPYQARDGLRTTPTLAAKTVRWLPRPSLSPGPEPPTGAPLAVILILVGLLGIGTAVFLYYRVRPRVRFAVPRTVDFQHLTPESEEKNQSVPSEPADPLRSSGA